jgi:hypothetical protein
MRRARTAGAFARSVLECIALSGCGTAIESTTAPAASEMALLTTSGAPTTSPGASGSALPGLGPRGAGHFAQFLADIASKCPFEGRDFSAAGRASAALGSADCKAKLMAADAERLAPAQRGALIDGDPQGPHARSSTATASLWTEVADARCRVESAQTWLTKSWLFEGSTVVAQGQIVCRSSANTSLAYFMRAWADQRPEDLVKFVRWRATLQPEPKARLARWREHAERSRKAAPLDASSDCRPPCRWSDAAWITLTRDLEHVERGATAIGVATCREWSALRSAFGGAADCERAISSHWLPSAPLLADDGAVGDEVLEVDPAETTLGPPPDDAFDRATLTARRGWTVGEGELAGAAAYLDAAEAEVAAANRPELAAWVKRAATFRDRLAVADARAELMGVSSATAGWTAPPTPKNGPTMRLLEGFLLRSLVGGSVSDLAAHMRARNTFGSVVEKQLGEVGEAFKRPCKSDGLRTCDGMTPSGGAQVARRLAWLLGESRALGKRLCEASPELRGELGNECATIATRHLLSFAKHAGNPNLLDGWQ